jgi:hypothetical protein
VNKTCNAFAILFALLATSGRASAQIIPTIHFGLGYLEHFSLGIGSNFGTRHKVAILYGSDLFIKPKKFSTYTIQYHYDFNGLRVRNATPHFGVKAGRAVYTDTYYTWTVYVLVPFIGVRYPLHANIDFLLQGGAAFSFEQSVKRLRFGEIGHYKSILPEGRLGFVYMIRPSRK